MPNEPWDESKRIGIRTSGAVTLVTGGVLLLAPLFLDLEVAALATGSQVAAGLLALGLGIATARAARGAVLSPWLPALVVALGAWVLVSPLLLALPESLMFLDALLGTVLVLTGAYDLWTRRRLQAARPRRHPGQP